MITGGTVTTGVFTGHGPIAVTGRTHGLGASHIVSTTHVPLPTYYRHHTRFHSHRHSRFFTACYPYYGYFWIYPFVVLDLGCDYYSWSSVRYGACRLSLYVTCTHLGYDHHCGYSHHTHRYHCGVHGWHYYHLRDCHRCYPVDHTYYIDRSVHTTTAEKASDQLAPGELSFCEGVSLYRAGDYRGAQAALEQAALELPASGTVVYYLALAHFALGDYEAARDGFALAVERRPELLSLRWDPDRHHSSADTWSGLRERLRLAIESDPNNGALRGVDAVLSCLDSDLDSARRAAGQVLLFDDTNALARAVVREVEGEEPGAGRVAPSAIEAALKAWFADPQCATIPQLELDQH